MKRGNGGGDVAKGLFFLSPWLVGFSLFTLTPIVLSAWFSFCDYSLLEPLLPRVVRPFNYSWGAAAFPSAVPGAKDVSYCVSDVLVIPRGAKHPREAFEFMAFCQRQEEMEKLCAMSGKTSPLKRVSDDYIYSNPNPYVDVFDRLADSPNAAPIDQTPIYGEASGLIDVAINKAYLLELSPTEALNKAQAQIEALAAQYRRQEALRR